MEYMTTKEAAKKWNVSERRIRALLNEGRIEGSKKLDTWLIPSDALKPSDSRKKTLKNEMNINIDKKLLDELTSLKKELNKKRPFSKETLKSLKEAINLDWTYNSNGIEGNTLTLRETQIVLEGITVGGKSIKEHLEAINHESAIKYLDELVKDKNPITEWNIRNIHGIILKGIDDENAGSYRKENVLIKGATHIPPDHNLVKEEMENLINRYNDYYKEMHPIIRASILHVELVKIHPFIDGNGRASRLLMNLDLINSGYLPVIIKKEDRLKYYEALDKAHTKNDYTDFIKLIIKSEKEMFNKYFEVL